MAHLELGAAENAGNQAARSAIGCLGELDTPLAHL